MNQFLMVGVLLLAAPAWALLPGESPTVFSVVGSTFKITGGTHNRHGGSAIYMYQKVEVETAPDGTKTVERYAAISDLDGADLNVAGPGCEFDSEQPGYILCDIEHVRTIKVSLAANPENDVKIIPQIDPTTGVLFQFPTVESLQLKSTGMSTRLELVDGQALFPNLRDKRIKTRSPFQEF